MDHSDAAGAHILLMSLQDRDQGEISERMAEFLTLAEAVRGLKGKGNTVSHVGSPKPAPAEAPAAAALAAGPQELLDQRPGQLPARGAALTLGMSCLKPKP